VRQRHGVHPRREPRLHARPQVAHGQQRQLDRRDAAEPRDGPARAARDLAHGRERVRREGLAGA
jgi:hypothetical protein